MYGYESNGPSRAVVPFGACKDHAEPFGPLAVRLAAASLCTAACPVFFFSYWRGRPFVVAVSDVKASLTLRLCVRRHWEVTFLCWLS